MQNASSERTIHSINQKPLLRQELGHIMHRNVDKFFDLLFPVTEKYKCVVDRIKQEGKWKNKWVELPID